MKGRIRILALALLCASVPFATPSRSPPVAARARC
jgi:hypothetical protein